MFRCLRRGKSIRDLVWRTSSRGYCSGDRLHGYTVTAVNDIPEFNLTAVELVHEATNARHCHVIKDDSNNTFSVAFATTPMDDTGVAHILEHTALCGSRKYPIRDPFFKMLTRSFSTFMNAFTGPDFTMYPFSSQNKQDFYNLMSVYCDAAFFPTLSKLDFLQEGWRLEHSDKDDKNSDIVFKGVVFNEMKGYNNNSGYIVGQSVLNNLLASHTYKSCSGGSPPDIPSLSHEQLVSFHQSHYHPSNAIFYTYGDLPLEEHLQELNKVLGTFKSITPNTLVPSEPQWDAPREMVIRGPHDPNVKDNDNNLTVAVSYKLPTLNDRYQNIALSIITDVLTIGAQSKFYEALIQAELGSDFADGSGFHTYTKDSFFTIGLKGVAQDNVRKVREAIDSVWKEVASDGLPADQVAAVLHQMEISKKHQSTSFGLHLGMGLIGAWLHGAEPAKYLELNTHLERFKELDSKGGHIEDMISRYFVRNQHRLTVTVVPDEDFGSSLAEKEAAVLQEKVSQLTEQGKLDLERLARDLQSSQDEVQDLSCLPCIQLKDVPREPLHYPTQSTTVEGVPVQIYVGPTNGISYFRCLISDADLANEQASLLPTYSTIVSQVGSSGKSYQQFDLEKMMRTGKFSCSTHLAPLKDTMDRYRLGTLLSSYCLNKNLPYMIKMWTDLLSQPHFTETDRIKALLDSEVAAQKDQITQSGHHYAVTRSRSHISPVGELGEQLHGFRQAESVLAYHAADIQNLVGGVAGTHVALLDRSLFSVAVNTTPDLVEENLEAISLLLKAVPDSKSAKDYGIRNQDISSVDSINEFVEIKNLGVNFCGRSYRTVPATHPDSAKLAVLASLLSSKFLHKEIREKGGAYGGGAMANQQSFSFFSYRDPNNMLTLDVFDRAATWASEGLFTVDQLDEAKISILGKLDAPVAPGARGATEFLGGMDLEQKQAFRNAILECSSSGVQDVACQYLSPSQLHGNVVIGPDTETASFRDRGFLVNTFGREK